MLFRRLATWGEGGLLSKSQLQTANHQARTFTEGFRGLQVEGGGYVQNSTVSSDNHLEVSQAVV